MHMSLDDFDRLTPEEFDAVAEAYVKETEAAKRDRWERTRTCAAWAVAPYIKEGADPTKLIPLPWDAETDEEAAAAEGTDKAELTTEQLMERYRAAIETRNGKIN